MVDPTPTVALSPEEQGKKKVYRATTTWHLSKPNPFDPLDRVRRLDLHDPEMYEAKGEGKYHSPVVVC